MFWEDLLQKTIEKSPNIAWENYKSARTIFNYISIELSKHMWYKHTQLDDVTLTTIEYKAEDYNEENDVPLEIPNNLITEWKW
jgi:hypothetical protein